MCINKQIVVLCLGRGVNYSKICVRDFLIFWYFCDFLIFFVIFWFFCDFLIFFVIFFDFLWCLIFDDFLKFFVLSLFFCNFLIFFCDFLFCYFGFFVTFWLLFTRLFREILTYLFSDIYNSTHYWTKHNLFHMKVSFVLIIKSLFI